MLKSNLLHPEILEALGSSGHGSRVLIADGNYPFATKVHPGARQVYLNLAPGVVTVPEVLETLTHAIEVETARVMKPDSGGEPAIFDEFRELLPGTELEKLSRFPFYDEARDPDTALIVATGEQRTWANIMLTVGVVPEDS